MARTIRVGPARAAAFVCMLALSATYAAAQVDVPTQHNDNARTGANFAESVLTTSNVNPAAFGAVFSRPVDDQIYAQPLVVGRVAIPGAGPRSCVFVATVNNSVYCFDAEDPAAAAPYWRVNFNDPANGVLPVHRSDVGQACGVYNDFSGNIGIVGTPVIDVAGGTLYVVARTKESGTFVQRLHALDVATGAERPGSPVVIQAAAPGIGVGSAGGTVFFNSKTHNQRPALLLANDTVYVGWASHCDTNPYHGWLIGYDKTSLRQTAVFVSTPDGDMGGIWQSGEGPSADESGTIFHTTGNGTFNGAGGRDFGNAFLKLSPGLARLDWFVPYNYLELNAADLDLGSTGVLLIPGTNLLVSGGKEGKLYLLDRDDLGGHRAGSDSQIVQSFQATSTGHLHGSAAYWRTPAGERLVYLWAESDRLKAWKLLPSGVFQTAPAMQSAVAAPDGMPGAMLSVSSSGDAPGTGIVWASHQFSGNANQQVRPGILRAFDATDLTRELWNSKSNAARDDAGAFAKFNYPTVANGRVYLATFSNRLVAYGLLSGAPVNQPPAADAGANQAVTLPAAAGVSGKALDDGLPRQPGALSFSWDVAAGPGTVTFASPASASTQATFSAAGVYVLRLTVSDGQLSSTDEVVVTANPPAPPGSGTGLTARYYNDAGDGQYFTTLALTRTDATVDFDWGGGSPGPGVRADDFSVRWTGRVQAPQSGAYVFSTRSDDGVRLWVDNQLVIDNWTDHAPTTDAGAPVTLVAGAKYDVVMEYYERGGGAVAMLSWSHPGAADETVPQQYLYPGEAGAPAAGAGLTGLYFNDPGDGTHFAELALARTDATVDFDWGAGPPGPGVRADDFSVRWTGRVQAPQTGSYTFSTRAAGGVRLWVDGRLLVDEWADRPRTTDTSAPVELVAGRRYDVVMELYQRAGRAGARLLWAPPGGKRRPIPRRLLYPGVAGTGARGQYFDDAALADARLTRDDAQIFFNWAQGSPSPDLAPDTFSVRWTGKIQPAYDEQYVFYATADDGVRVWVDGELLIDRWSGQPSTTWTGTTAAPLRAGRLYDVRVEYIENTGDAFVRLEWSSASQGREVVPRQRLYPTP